MVCWSLLVSFGRLCCVQKAILCAIILMASCKFFVFPPRMGRSSREVFFELVWMFGRWLCIKNSTLFWNKTFLFVEVSQRKAFTYKTRTRFCLFLHSTFFFLVCTCWQVIDQFLVSQNGLFVIQNRTLFWNQTLSHSKDFLRLSWREHFFLLNFFSLVFDRPTQSLFDPDYKLFGNEKFFWA